MTTEAKKEEGVILAPKIHEISKIMDSQVSAVVGDKTLQGFERFFLVAQAAGKLKEALTDEYMQPIMALQNNRLGFKCDKVYPIDVVRNCIIEAVLMGVQPVGNHFNIIAGNSYITKEGFGYLLGKTPGLYYDIVPELPRIKDTSAAVVMNIKWNYGGVANEKSIDFAIKVNQYMGADAVIGKATRKARAWLYGTITGSEMPEGDAADMIQVKGRVVDKTDENKEAERFLTLIADSGDRAEINMYFQGCTPEVQELVKEEYEKRIDYLDQIEDSKGQKKEDKK